MEYTGERFTPDNSTNSIVIMEHWHRYLWVNNYVTNKVVLDIACGEGYGSNYLAQSAHHVYGCDISQKAIDWCTSKYKKDNLEYKVMDIANLEFDDNSIDIITNFETIEHVDSETQDKALGHFRRVLKDDGILFISTPCIESSLHCKGNKYHLCELSYKDFKSKLEKHFKYVEIIEQFIYISSVIGPCNENTAKIYNFSETKDKGKYMLALCSDYPVFAESSVLINRENGLLNKITSIRNIMNHLIPIKALREYIKKLLKI